jgi:hypothetical protein
MGASTSLAFDVGATTNLPLTPAAWDTSHGNATFQSREAFPGGLMQVTSESEEGYVTLKNTDFANGTIEFDIKPVTDEMPGLRFRQGADGSADMVYIRVSPDCPASHDCLQYLPLFRGRIPWDMYPQYQAPAPVRVDTWNHIRMVMSGERMSVYVNREATPSLQVDHLAGENAHGTIAFEGKALYANVTLAPDVTEGLAAQHEPDTTASDAHYLTDWEIAEPRPLAQPGEPTLSAKPSSGWRPLHAEHDGLVDLARLYPPTPRGAPRQYAWLRTSIHADRDETRHVQVAFLREITVFVNGQPSFQAKNLYNVPGGRQAPDGRLDLENGGFDLHLRKGNNEVVVAIDANTPDMRGRYGWGLKMKLDGSAPAP